MPEAKTNPAWEIGSLFTRDFDRLKTELSTYQNENDIWIVKSGISNSGGNLALHLLGNTRHFIGHVLGGSTYVRDRESEFELRNVPLTVMLAEVEQAKSEVITTLARLTPADMQKVYPLNLFGEVSTMHFLVHLYGHFNYHLGQINYHRRLVAG